MDSCGPDRSGRDEADMEPMILRDAGNPQRIRRATDDLTSGLGLWRLAWALAHGDITERYRGSVLGPIWLTLSTALMLGMLGVLYAKLFRIDLAAYLPWLTASLVIWNILSQSITEACITMTSAEGVIRQMPLPYTLHALRMVFRNALVAVHNLPLIPIVLALFGIFPGWGALMAVPGLILLAFTVFCAGLLFGAVCARFRDIPPIVASVMQIAFFMTPIIWKPELVGHWQPWLPLNPFYSMMEIVRGPLLGTPFMLSAWIASLVYSGLLALAAFALFARFRNRIAFWV